MTAFAFFMIILVLGVIVGNIMLLKHSAKMKMSLKNLNQDPIELARKRLQEKQQAKSKSAQSPADKQMNKQNKDDE